MSAYFFSTVRLHLEKEGTRSASVPICVFPPGCVYDSSSVTICPVYIIQDKTGGKHEGHFDTRWHLQSHVSVLCPQICFFCLYPLNPAPFKHPSSFLSAYPYLTRWLLFSDIISDFPFTVGFKGCDLVSERLCGKKKKNFLDFKHFL